MDRLSAMRLFRRVVETGTISAAGRSLGLSTTAASKRIQDLEADLSARLLDRTTRHATPTEAGRHLYRRVTPLLDELDAALSETTALHDEPTGTLRILARRSFGLLQVVAALPSFRVAYPKVEIDLTLTEESDLSPNPGYDIAFRLGPPSEKSLAAVKVAASQRLLCGSPTYLADHPPPHTADDLDAHDLLVYSPADGPVTWVFEGPRGRSEIAVAGRLRSNSGEVLQSAAVNGMGLVLHPEWMMRQAIRDGALVPVMTDHNIFAVGYNTEIFAVWTRAELVPAKITAFLRHITGKLGTIDDRAGTPLDFPGFREDISNL